MGLLTQGYAVVMCDQKMHDHGVYWRAFIHHDGVVIGTCHNEGRGGPTVVVIPDTTARDAYQQAATRACPRSHEAPSRFAERLADYADGFDDDDED